MQNGPPVTYTIRILSRMHLPAAQHTLSGVSQGTSRSDVNVVLAVGAAAMRSWLRDADVPPMPEQTRCDQERVHGRLLLRALYDPDPAERHGAMPPRARAGAAVFDNAVKLFAAMEDQAVAVGDLDDRDHYLAGMYPGHLVGLAHRADG